MIDKEMEINKKLSWSKFVKTITVLVTLLLLVAAVSVVWGLQQSTDSVGFAVLILIVAVPFCFILQTPVRIQIVGQQLILKKIVGNVTINISDIREIGVFVPDSIELRLFGSGGLYGYIGIFRNSELGNYRSYVGNYSQSFYVVLNNNRKYVFSCRDREEVIASVQQKMN